MNRPEHERFEQAYRRLWGALRRPDDADLSQHELGLLHHVAAQDGVALTRLARHLALPKSTASVLVKDLERRGFLRRLRDSHDERSLAIVLTPAGQARVDADTVLDSGRLAAALGTLSVADRRRLVAAIERLAAAGEAQKP